MSVDEIYAAYREGKLTTVEVKKRLSQLAGRARQVPKAAAAFALSEAQRGLWFLQQAVPRMSAYNVPVAIQLPTAVDDEAFDAACRRLVAHYPILTTAITDQDGRSRQRERSGWTPPIRREDVSGLSSEQLMHHLKRLVREPFPTNGETLFRVDLLRRSSARTIVVFSVHHVIFDGRSILPLVRTFMRCYQGALEQARANPPAAAFSYQKFVDAESNLLASAEGARRLSFWRDFLEGHEDVLQLPTDRPRTPQRSFKGETHRYKLSAELSSRLRQLCRSNVVYPSTLFLGIYKMLLAQYTGMKDIVVGMPVDSRPLVTEQPVVGLFANMMPIRSAYDGATALKDFLKRLQLTVIRGIANAYPFSALVRELRLASGAEESPLFQVSYAYQGAAPESEQPYADRASGGLDIEFIEELSQEGEYELCLEIYERQQQFGINLKYDSEMFEAETIATMMERYVGLLETVAKDPGRSLGGYSLLSAAERRKLLVDWNDTKVERPVKQCIIELFEQQARTTPQAVAIRSAERTVTYSQLSERSTLLAGILRRRGLQGNPIVAVCVERSVEMMWALLAVQKAGGAYLPLDPDYPPERLAYMLQDSRATIILTQKKLRTRVSEVLDSAGGVSAAGVQVIVLDEPWEDASTHSTQPVIGDAVDPSHLVYVLYTSGSTGQPKGVMLEHRALYNRIVWMQEHYGLRPADRVLQKTPLSFDVSGWELYWPLIVGAELVLLPPGEHKDSSALIRFIDAQQVSVAHFVPSMLETFLRTDSVGTCRSLRHVFCSGESLTPAQCDLFFDRLPTSALHNLYGPTEAAIDVTYWPCVRNARTVPIGKPVANTRLYILDEQLSPTPVGIAGELHIAGVGLARGYLNNPELSARKFIPDPFSARAAERMYKTGDRCRWRSDGQIEFLGRLDEQVKLRGLRIELGEVEAHVGAHPQIQNCVAVIAASNGHKRLVAWLVGAAGAPRLSDEQLRQFLSSRVPDHMIPAAFAYIDAIPLTASGKTNRKALCLRALPQQSQAGSKAQASDVEHEIAAIWRALLQRADVDGTRGFFDLGGDSLLAVSAINQVNRKFDTRLTVTTLFRYPTVKGLAVHVSEALAACSQSIGAQPADAGANSSRTRAQQPANSSGIHGEGGSYPEYYRDSLAIIGISCSVPGASNHFDFWRNLTEGRESVRLLTPTQLREAGVPQELIANPRFVPACSSIEDKDWFDPQFFGISPRDAQFMNPQFRLLLQHAWLAIEDAGYRASDIPETAVFMSEGNTLYSGTPAGHAEDAMESDSYVSWMLAQGGSTPTMISHKLGLTGPSHAVHSNCSSSLIGLYSACLNIRAGKCKTALVGAATILGTAAPGYLYHPSMNFSSDGHLKAFDAKADGMIAAEGVVVLLVKHALDAVEQGDNIYALVRGIEVNNDGREKAGFYAPSFEGQRKVIEKVLAATRVAPDSISYVEAHGTGTKLGDPIELGALSEAYGRPDGRLGYCGVGSLKSNIGHLDTAAGLAGCLKVALSLHHGAIPPSINFSEPNPDIDFEHSPFYVVDRLTPWREGVGPKRAAVSSFGIGGTNAHAILESHHSHRAPANDRAVVIPIAAKTPERLTAYVESFRDFLTADDARARVTLPDLAYTFQVGREPMDCRVAFVAASASELLTKLSQYLSEESGSAGIFRWERQRVEAQPALLEDDADTQDLVRRWAAQGRIDKLAQLWVRGINVDWELLYATMSDTSRPRRSPAPTYPFVKQRVQAARHASGELKKHSPGRDTAPRDAVAAAPSPEPQNVGAWEVSHASGASGARAEPWDKRTYLVQWEPEPGSTDSRGSALDLIGSAVALLVCAGHGAHLEETIREELERNRSVRTLVLQLRAAPTERISRDEWIADVRDPRAISTCLEGISALQAVFFLADAGGSSSAPHQVHASQLQNEMQLYRLIKHLRSHGQVSNRLECFLLTFDHYDLEPGRTQYAGGGIHGLAYAVAQRDHRFRVRNIDLSSSDLSDAGTRHKVLRTILNTPASDRGELVKAGLRGRYRQVFIPLAYSATVKSGIAEHGVYVIAGGSGAVGQIVTRGLMQKYHAQVIWLGRTAAADSSLQKKLSELAPLGARPLYIQADVTDPQSMHDAVKQIRHDHGRINGALFLACDIFGRAESLDTSEEAEFLHSSSVKTRGTAAFHAAFEHEPLDFMCYFSSAQAFCFSGASKLAALATGVTFSDAFVRSLRGQSSFPMGTVNWGAWRSSLGSALSEHMGALTDEEGFTCFERATGALQQGDLRQFVCLSVSAGVRGLMNCRDEERWIVQGNAEPVLASIRQAVRAAGELPEIFRNDAANLPVSFDECLARILLYRLREMGVFNRPGEFIEPQALRQQAGILTKYSRWWIESLRILQSFGYVEYRDGKVGVTHETLGDPGSWVWAPWYGVKEQYLNDPDRRAFVPIAEACFDRLREVLTGKTLATDVLFPGGSMAQMEGVYRANAVADYFNTVVADVVAACVRSRVERDPRAQIRIIEIGAGTGGTTSKVIPRLAPHARNIREYCYTDLSKAFLLIAEDQFRANAPYLACRLWDIEKPLADSDASLGCYDIAIATNVLHATRNVRRALSNAKAALGKSGILVLNEGTSKNVYGSLIMGLLEGWWLYEDEAERIPGCPYLDARSWRRVLTLEGFRDIYYPVEVAEPLGQQIIVAESDGVIKVRHTTASTAVTAFPAPAGAQRSRTGNTGLTAAAGRSIREHVESTIRRCLADALRTPADQISRSVAFSDYGVDSILGVGFTESINKRLGLALNPAILFDYTSIERLASYLVETFAAALEASRSTDTAISVVQVEPEVTQPEAPVDREQQEQRSVRVGDSANIAVTSAEIAVIGVSGQFPGANDVERFWENLSRGQHGVSELPPGYLDAHEHFAAGQVQDAPECKCGGVLAERDCFDPLFFNISPREADSMNPHQRLVLQESWKALEDAGYDPRRLSGADVGVYIGSEPSGYFHETFTGSSEAIIASRLSYFANFNGPTMVINTACSSSAVAIHLACEALRSGQIDIAIAGGVNASLSQAALVPLAAVQMLSPSGRCRTFDDSADGTVLSEAVGIVVLKRLEQAERDGDSILGVICASGINQDGASNGITAPNGLAQERLIKDVYKRFGIDAADISYVEAHGTGTKLGDPVEANALARAFRHFTERQGYCALGSAKAHIGHTAAGAGAAGLIKVLLSLQHRQIPGLLHFSSLNSLIDFDGSAFYINRECQQWQPAGDKPRMAALNSFGHSGTNAHIVIREHLGGPRPALTPPHPVIVPLSARREDVLKNYARKLLEYLSRSESMSEAGTTGRPALSDIAYTLQIGREPMSHRVALLAATHAELRQRIDEFLNNSADGVSCWSGVAGDSQDEPDTLLQAEDLGQLMTTWLGRGRLDKIARLWVKGADVDWSVLWSGQAARRVRLPTYPFLKNRHGKNTAFIERGAGSARASSNEPVSSLHPLVQRNTSTLDEQRFTTLLTGKEFFLSDHLVQGKPIMPGVAYIEMARMAVSASLGAAAGEQTRIHLKNIIWRQPLVVAEAREVHIGLQALDNGEIEFEIYTSRVTDAGRDDIVHVQGRAVASDARIEDEALDIATLQSVCTRTIEIGRCYDTIQMAGVAFGPALRGLTALKVGTDEQDRRCVLATLALPGSVSATADQYFLHPSVLDSALQASIGLVLADADGQSASAASRPLLPFALEKLEIWDRSPKVALAYVRPSEVPGASGLQKLDVDVCDETGRVCVRLSGLTSRAIESLPPTSEAHASESVTTRCSGEEFYLQDHHQLLPAVMYLELARAAAAGRWNTTVAAIGNVVWLDLLRVSGAGSQIQVSLSPADESCSFRVSVAETSSRAKIYAQGSLTLQSAQDPDNPKSFDVEAIRARCSLRIEGAECDRIVGATHGRRMLPLQWMQHNDREGLARLTLPDGLDESHQQYVLHPSTLHGALIAAICFALIQEGQQQIRLPYALERLRIYSRTPKSGYVYVRQSETNGSRENNSKHDIDVLDDSGRCAIAIRGFTAVAAEKGQTEGVLFAAPRWEARPITERVVTADHELPMFVLAQDNADLRRGLQARWPGATVETLAPVGEDVAGTICANFLNVMELLKRSVLAKSQRSQPVVVLVEEDEHSHLHAALAGLMKSAAMENSRLSCKLVRHAPGSGTDVLLGQLRDELAAGDRQVEVRYRGAAREIRRLHELQLRGPRSVAEVVRSGNVLWITGGLGGLGQIFARHLGAVSGVSVVVSGRSAAGASQRAALEALQAQGIDARYLRCDVSSAEEVGALVDSVQREIGDISGIIHCAGVTRDSYLVNKTAEEARAVLAPKIAGVLALDQASRSLSLEFMVLCSSIAAGGNAGQADYAGANSFLDEFAHHRNELVRQGLRSGHTVSVNWPLWREGGMQVGAQLEELSAHLTGMRAMDTQTGIQSLLAALLQRQTQVLVAPGDVQKIRAVLLQERSRNSARGGTSVTSTPKQAVAEQFADDARDRQSFAARVTRALIENAGEVLTMDAHLIEPGTDLSRYGFDSISLTEFTNHLNRRYGLELMPTVFFECPTLESLAQYLVNHHETVLRAKFNDDRRETSLKSQAAPAPAEKRAEQHRRSGRRRAPASTEQLLIESTYPRGRQQEPHSTGSVPEPIAIIGMSGCFPRSPDIESFWRALDEGKDCITEIPPERWDWRAIYGDPSSEGFKTNVKWGGFIDSAMSFDPLFFGISPREAESMDPQQRLLMTYAWKVIEEAGYAPSSLAGTRTAVYVGTADTGFSTLVAQAGQSIEGFSGTGLAQSVGPNRVSFLLDLHGPSEPIDTACSSSLVAIHRAVNALRAGQCDLAIAGGVNTILTPTVHVGYAKAGMLSPQGRCKAFSDSADGFARGEGVGLLLLKRLKQAQSAGDHIEGVILDIGENHGGRAASLTAPNMKAQADLIRSVYEQAQIDPRTVTYIEAHGTGTQLGDPVEINGLKSAFAALYESTAGSALPAARCGVGSVKSNIGHLELAAGVAGVIKVLLQMRQRRLVPTLHCQTINPYIDLTGTPFYIVNEPREWPALQDEQGRTLPRRAGVSSFGFAGVNTHVLIEEYCGSHETHDVGRGPYVLVLSARIENQLQQHAKNLLDAFRSGRYVEADMARIAYTLQVGRDAMGERLGFVTSGLADAAEKLHSYLQGTAAPNGIYRGQVKAGKAALSIFRDNRELQEAIGKWVERGRFEALLELWVQGLEMDWGCLYAQQRPARISLPTYPFSQQIYWPFEVTGSQAPHVAAGPHAPLPEMRDGAEPVEDETTLTLTPVWDPVALAQDAAADLEGKCFLCVGIDPEAVRHLANHAARAETLDLQPGDSIEQIAQRLERSAAVDHIVWAFRNPPAADVDGEVMIAAQREGVMLCFKVIKALLSLGYQNRKLTWTVLTERTIAVSERDSVVAVHAGVHGLVGSLSKENLNWTMHVVDLSAYAQHPALLLDCLRLPPPQPWEDDTWAHRNGSWYRQRLLDFEVGHA